MPSFAHFMLGGCFGLLLYNISNKKFTKAHVFLLFLNNYLGPDIGWVLGIGEYTHTLLGSIPFALILALLNSYFTRFSPDFQKKILIDLGKPRIDYLSAFFVVFAGLIMHNYLDALINYNGLFFIWPSIGSIERFDMWLYDFWKIWQIGKLSIHSSATIAIGGALIFIFFYLFVVLLKNWNTKSILGIIGICGVFSIAFYLFGGQMVTNHGDMGALLLGAIYWLLPLALCVASLRNYLEPYEKIYQNLKRFTEFVNRTLWHLIIIWNLLLVGIGLGLSIGSNVIIEYIVDYFTIWDNFTPELQRYFIFTGIVFIVFGIFFLVLSKSQRILAVKPLGWRFILLISWLSLTGLLGTLGGLAGLIMPNAIEHVLYIYFGDELNLYLTLAVFRFVVPIIGTALVLLGLFNFILSLGLAVHIRIIWRLTFFYHLIQSNIFKRS